MNDNTNPAQSQTYNQQFWADYNEKRAIKRAAWAIGVPAILFFLISKYWADLAVMLGARFGISAEKIAQAVSEPAVKEVVQIVLALLLFTLPFIISAKLAGFSVSRSAGLNIPRRGTAFPYLLFGVGFCAFANVAVTLAGRVFEKMGFHGFSVKEAEPKGLFGFFLVCISTVLVPALIEEFAFRGIVIGLLKPFGEGFSIFASAAAFGILHGNFDQIPFAFLVGLILGYIRIKTGSIAVCMAVHAVNNAVAVALSYTEPLPAAVVDSLYTVYVMLALLAAVWAAVLLGKDSFRLNKPDTVNTTKKICVEYFYNPATLIFYALFVFRACEYIF